MFEESDIEKLISGLSHLQSLECLNLEGISIEHPESMNLFHPLLSYLPDLAHLKLAAPLFLEDDLLVKIYLDGQVRDWYQILPGLNITWATIYS